jgi:hypothetical protein
VPRVIEPPPPRKPPYFWWVLANALALCFAIVSWVVCLDVFRHPEEARNYKILAKLKRLPELKQFQLFDAPSAPSLSSVNLYKKFQGFNDEQLNRLNRALLRNYITNFKQPLLINYVEGNFNVESVRPLTDGDFITTGFVVRARAVVKPDEYAPVILEYVFPTTDPAAFSWFKPHDLLSVTKAPNCAVVLHVTKVPEEDGHGGVDHVLCVTVVPIVYGDYRVGSERLFSLEPPPALNPGAAFPFFRP